jgi:hypothetical protein
VPTALADCDLFFDVSRKEKNETLVCIISASGDAYCPLLISADQKCRQLFESRGVRENVDLSIEVRKPAYMTTVLFEWYICNKFLYIVESERKGCNPDEKPAVLFFDNCRSHCSPELLRITAEAWVIVITYPPHTSQVFQVLDRVVFANIKSEKRKIRRDSELIPAVDRARRILAAYEHCTGSETVRSGWRHTGFEYVMRNGEWHLDVNCDKIAQFREWQVIWSRNYDESKMSPRRRSQRWGWINMEYFPEEFQERVMTTRENDLGFD